MNAAVVRALAALLSGVLFGLGLVLSGMTQPQKVLGFLDVFGSWDPSLLFVMVGAIGVHFFLYRLIKRRSAPLAAAQFSLPTKTQIDAKLVIGAALFGVGWGLAGYCPGPSVVAMASGMQSTLIFFSALVVGSALVNYSRARQRVADPAACG